jgi:SNF2 family DNA or RNA helicase
MKPGSSIANAVSKLHDKIVPLKARMNRASVLINSVELKRILSGDMPMSKAATLLVAAWLYEAGFIRFIASRGKKVQGGIDIGVDKDVSRYFNAHEFNIQARLKRGGWRLPTLEIPVFKSSDHMDDLVFSIKNRSNESSTTSLLRLTAPHTFGQEYEENSGASFGTPVDTVVYHLSKLLDKLNDGDIAMSSIFEAIEEHLKKRKILSIANIKDYIADLENVLPPDKLSAIMDAKDSVLKIDIPDINPHIPPHEYQWKGVNWMLAAERGVLAFGTGLGKTYISILFTYIAKRMGLTTGSIVFTKEKIITDFEREIRKLWPSAKIVIMHGTQQDRLSRMSEAADADFVICSYGPLIRKMPEMIEFFNDNKDMAVIFDEGSRVRNTRTNMRETTESIIEDRKFVFIMDATPFPNDVLMDSYNLIDLLRHNQLGTQRAWKKRFAQTQTTTLSTGRQGAIYTNLEEMREAIAPIIYVKRESDSDVDAELPPERHEYEKVFTMGPEQSKWYIKAVEMTLEELVNMMDPRNQNFRDPKNVLASIVRQRQTAVSPRLVDPTYLGDEDRLELIVDLVEEWLTAEDTTVIIGAEFRSIFPRLRAMIAERLPHLTDDEIQELSGKTTGLKEIDRVKAGLNSGAIKVGLLGITSAGAGINLQGNCHRIILIHKPWNPNKVTQFIDRVDRQGQKRRVSVVHFIAEDTIDIRIEDTLARKAFEQEQMLSGQEAEKAGKLSIKELATMAGIQMEDIKRRAEQRGISSNDIDNIADQTTVATRDIG